MAKLAAILVSLALLHVALGLSVSKKTKTKPPTKKPTKPPTKTTTRTSTHGDKDLDIVGTDHILDVIRYYNKHYTGKVPAPNLPDIIRKNVKLGHSGSYDLYVKEGKMYSQEVKLDTDRVDFNLTIDKPYGFTRHLIRSGFPIVIEDLVLRYDELAIDFKMVDRVTKKTPRSNFGSWSSSPSEYKADPSGAVTVNIGRNKFTVLIAVAHYYKDHESACVATIEKVKADEFDVTDLKISGITNPVVKAIVNALASRIKESILKDSYAPSVIEIVIKQISSEFFPFCYYVPQNRFNSFKPFEK